MKRMRMFAVAMLGSVVLGQAVPAVAQRRTAAKAAPAPYYPDQDWERRSPDAVGMDAALLQEAIAFAVESERKAPRDLALEHNQSFLAEPFNQAIGPFTVRGDPTGIVLRHGYLVAEWGDPARVDMTFSVTKSFVSTVAGLALDRGLIRDFARKVYDDLPLPEFASDHNRKITWDHLLRQTSDWEGTLWAKPDWADRPDKDPNTWTTRKRNDPGAAYEYNDVRVNALCLALTNVWRRPLPQVLRDEVMDPIGASRSWRWQGYENSWILLDGVNVQSVSGGGHWGGGMQISAYDQARFGLFTLRRGQWRDRRLLSERFFAQALASTPAEPTYGFMNFFLNPERRRMPSAPESSFAHLGAGTNMIYVDPENDLVVVARWIESAAQDGVVKRVLAAIRRK
jgi:CubicO group peptidase (beta-lactamase class C family)